MQAFAILVFPAARIPEPYEYRWWRRTSLFNCDFQRHSRKWDVIVCYLVSAFSSKTIFNEHIHIWSRWSPTSVKEIAWRLIWRYREQGKTIPFSWCLHAAVFSWQRSPNNKTPVLPNGKGHSGIKKDGRKWVVRLQLNSLAASLIKWTVSSLFDFTAQIEPDPLNKAHCTATKWRYEIDPTYTSALREQCSRYRTCPYFAQRAGGNGSWAPARAERSWEIARTKEIRF